jgi:predicted membrane-bound spermidine synthase
MGGDMSAPPQKSRRGELIRLILAMLGVLSLAVALIGFAAVKSDIQIILAMLGVIGGILGLGLGAIIGRIDELAKQAKAILPENDGERGRWRGA